MTFITRPRRDTAALAKRRIDKGWHTATLQVLVDQQVFKTCHAAWSFFVMSASLASTSQCESSGIATLVAMALANHQWLCDAQRAERRHGAPQETLRRYKCRRSLPSPKVSQLRGDCWEPIGGAAPIQDSDTKCACASTRVFTWILAHTLRRSQKDALVGRDLQTLLRGRQAVPPTWSSGARLRGFAEAWPSKSQGTCANGVPFSRQITPVSSEGLRHRSSIVDLWKGRNDSLVRNWELQNDHLGTNRTLVLLRW